MGECFNTDITITLALPQTGLSEKRCGKILLADIGIPKLVYNKMGIDNITVFKNDFIIKLKE